MNRIYYINRYVKDRFPEVKVDVKNRRIESAYDHIENVPTPCRYYVRQLLKMGFQHQLRLF